MSTYTQSFAEQLIYTRWFKAHKLAMFVMYSGMDAPNAHKEAMTNQLLYLQAKDEEAQIWARMDTDDYLDYLRILEQAQGDS